MGQKWALTTLVLSFGFKNIWKSWMFQNSVRPIHKYMFIFSSQTAFQMEQYLIDMRHLNKVLYKVSLFFFRKKKKTAAADSSCFCLAGTYTAKCATHKISYLIFFESFLHELHKNFAWNVKYFDVNSMPNFAGFIPYPELQFSSTV